MLQPHTHRITMESWKDHTISHNPLPLSTIKMVGIIREALLLDASTPHTVGSGNYEIIVEAKHLPPTIPPYLSPS